MGCSPAAALSPWSVLIQVFDLTGGRDRHVRVLTFALKLGTGDRPVICQARSMFFLAHDLGAPGRTTDAVGGDALSCLAALSLPALFVAPVAARWSARAPVVLLRRLFALCLAAVAVRLLLSV